MSRLEDDMRLLIDTCLWCPFVTWVDGGREGDFMGGVGAERSRVTDRRCSLTDERLSLIKSLIIVMEERLSFLGVTEEVLRRRSRDKRLSCKVSFEFSA